MLLDDTTAAFITEKDLSIVLSKLKQLRAIKDVLDRMHVFHENSIRYAKLEAAALLRVVELGGMSQLKGTTLGVAKWLSSLSRDQVEKAVAMCDEGMTISQIWKREVQEPNHRKAALDYLRDRANTEIEIFRKQGAINLSKFSSEAKNHVDAETAEDLVDGLRCRIRKLGGVGIGNNSLEYYYPTPENYDYQKAAIKLRIHSICADVRKLEELHSISGVFISPGDIGLSDASDDPCEKQLFQLFETIHILRA